MDPFGLIYRLISFTPPGGTEQQVIASEDRPEPLILRCREGEWVQVTLENHLPEWYHPKPEPFAPEVPVEEINPFSHRPERRVSTQVSMHADLVLYDVRTSDGANVGRNLPQTADKGESVTYTWHAHRPPNTNANEPLGPALLQDMADFRNHRHHGLIGALVVEDRYATPLRVESGLSTATGTTEAWHGSRATVSSESRINPRSVRGSSAASPGWASPVPAGQHPLARCGRSAGCRRGRLDKEDQGQKGFNYRSEPVGPNVDPNFDPKADVAPGEWPSQEHPLGDWLSNPAPATPVFIVPEKSKVHLHLVGACDKPRNHSFTVHGVSWPEWRFLPENNRRPVSSESAITTGTARTFEFPPLFAGDHAYRSGVLKWDVLEGLWGSCGCPKVW